MKRGLIQGQSAAMRRASTRQWVLKPQDLAVALKLATLDGKAFTYAGLAKVLHLSQFEVHAAVQRLIAARLAFELNGIVRPVMAALRNFVVNGAIHAYPPVRGELTIGLPTAHGAPPIKGHVHSTAESIPVWPYFQGKVRGFALLPLYEKLPLAAQNDAVFYELLALFDALRSGQARERNMAKRMLESKLQ